VDELPAIAGIDEVWGHQVYQCPYCHGWEVRDRAWGVLVDKPELLPWARLLSGWTSRLVVFTNGAELPKEERDSLENQGIRVRTEPIERLVVPSREGQPTLEAVALVGGAPEPCDALYVRPRQRPAPLVEALGLGLDEQGFVRLDEQRQSTLPGVYVAGDATTPMQAAIFAAQTGMATAAFVVHGLVHEMLTERQAARA
jgi:thioredoxin reductase